MNPDDTLKIAESFGLDACIGNLSDKVYIGRHMPARIFDPDSLENIQRILEGVIKDGWKVRNDEDDGYTLYKANCSVWGDTTIQAIQNAYLEMIK